MLKSRLNLRKVATIIACLAEKRMAVFAIALCISLSTVAQSQGDFAISPFLAVGSGKTAGIGGKLQYNLTNPLRLEGSFAYLLGESTVASTSNVIDVSLNGHYLFYIGDLRLVGNKMTPAYLYPLVGVGLYRATVKIDFLSVHEKVSIDRVGINLGGGVEQCITEKLSMFVEVKCGVGDDLSRLTALVGIAYRF